METRTGKAGRTLRQATSALAVAAAFAALAAPAASADPGRNGAVCDYSVPLGFSAAERGYFDGLLSNGEGTFSERRLGTIDCVGRVGDSLVSGKGTIAMHGTYTHRASCLMGGGVGSFKARLPRAITFFDKTYERVTGTFDLGWVNSAWRQNGSLAAANGSSAVQTVATLVSSQGSCLGQNLESGTLTGRMIIG